MLPRTDNIPENFETASGENNPSAVSLSYCKFYLGIYRYSQYSQNPPSSARQTEGFDCTALIVAQFFRYFFDTVRTNVAAFIRDNIFGVAAENAGRLVLFEDNGVVLNEGFQADPAH